MLPMTVLLFLKIIYSFSSLITLGSCIIIYTSTILLFTLLLFNFSNWFYVLETNLISLNLVFHLFINSIKYWYFPKLKTYRDQEKCCKIQTFYAVYIDGIKSVHIAKYKTREQCISAAVSRS